MPGVLDASALQSRRHDRALLAGQVGGLVTLALGLGALAGVVWWRVVDLPGYLVNGEGKASTSERGLANFIGGDAWFTLLGAAVGVLLGWLGWVRLGRRGWAVVPLVAGSALAAALLCWFVGHELGPGTFNDRLAAARPGDTVLIELTIRAKASLLVWPFAATIPILVGSSLGRDDEVPRPFGWDRWFKRRSAPPEPTSR